MSQAIRPVECMWCFKRVPAVYPVTAEDIQRKKPPLWAKWACADCLAKLRSNARLESNYHASRALIELALIVISIFVFQAAISLAIIIFAGPSILNGWYTPIFIGAVTFLSGLRIIWFRVGERYAFTHSLGWSLKSRGVIIGLALTLSGAVFAFVAPMML
jgi:hypothetical protein